MTTRDRSTTRLLPGVKRVLGTIAVVALLAGCTASAQRPQLVEGIKFNMGGWWVVNFHVSSSAGSDSLVFNLSL